MIWYGAERSSSCYVNWLIIFTGPSQPSPPPKGFLFCFFFVLKKRQNPNFSPSLHWEIDNLMASHQIFRVQPTPNLINFVENSDALETITLCSLSDSRYAILLQLIILPFSSPSFFFLTQKSSSSQTMFLGTGWLYQTTMTLNLIIDSITIMINKIRV